MVNFKDYNIDIENFNTIKPIRDLNIFELIEPGRLKMINKKSITHKRQRILCEKPPHQTSIIGDHNTQIT